MIKDSGISLRSLSIFMCFYRYGRCDIKLPLRTLRNLCFSNLPRDLLNHSDQNLVSPSQFLKLALLLKAFKILMSFGFFCQKPYSNKKIGMIKLLRPSPSHMIRENLRLI